MGYHGYGSAMTKCPFYIRDNERTVVCEGLIDNTSVLTKFPTKENKEMHQKCHCFNWPNTCPVSMHNMKKEGGIQ